MNFGRKNKHLSSSDISREELTRTQVLNLQELERIAKYEKETSKRPSMLFALAGILSISLGLAYPNIMMAVDSISLVKPTEIFAVSNENVSLDMKETLPIPTDKLVCTHTKALTNDGTNQQYKYEMFFKDNKLQSYVKTYTVTSIENNPVGPVTAQNIYNVYLTLANNNSEGYRLTPTLKNGNLTVVTDINLAKYDKSLLQEMQKGNLMSTVEYDYNMDKEVLKESITNGGFICQ